MLRSIFSLALVAMIGGVAQASLTDGLIAYYTFEDADPSNSGNGTAVIDQTGQTGNLVFTDTDAGTNNVDAVSDTSPAGYFFGNVFHGRGVNGPSGFAQGFNVLPNIPGEITMAAWFKLRPQVCLGLSLDCNTNGQEFFNIDGARMTVGVRGVADFPRDLTVRAVTYIYDGTTWNPDPGGAGQATDESGDVQQADNVWHHIVSTYSSTSGEIRLYLDGTFRASRNYGAGATIFPDDDIHIGGQDDGRAINGYIDEVAMWARVLSDAEVLELYNLPEPSTATLVVLGLGSFAGVYRRSR